MSVFDFFVKKTVQMIRNQAKRVIWDTSFKNVPSTICEREPSKNLK